MEITVNDLQKKIPLNFPAILKITKTILRHEGVNKTVLSVVFVNHQRIKALNKKFLNGNHATDVLAFNLGDSGSPRRVVRKKPKMIVGDIIISTDAVLKNMKTYHTALAGELTLYIIHGILHLLGYDDHKPVDVKRMRRKEQEILLYLGTKVNSVVNDKT